MNCPICAGNHIEITYKGVIRNGGLGKYTDSEYSIWKCCDCEVMWHDAIIDTTQYYESCEYRLQLEDSTEEEDFYILHDKESLDKFTYTGTDIFRNKIVADIGCGCGAFLDYLQGVARDIVAIEPSFKYQEVLRRKKYHTFSYTKDALKTHGGGVDLVVSFDVIEHVDNPKSFLQDIYHLTKDKGKIIIGTPTETPVMRALIGEDYEKRLLFSTQHIWVFGERNLKLLAQEVGFSDIKVRYYQRYGLSNLVGWVRDKRPKTVVNKEWITETLDSVYKKEVEHLGLSDYIVLYAEK